MNQNTKEKLQEEEIRITIRVNESRFHEVDIFEISKREVVFHWKSKFFRHELDNNFQVKFIFLGKILNDNQIISEIQFKNGQVIQAYIVETQQQQEEAQQQEVPQNQVQINIDMAMQEILNQHEVGSYWELGAGLVLGYVFNIFAILFQCMVNCSIRARQGIILGFIIRLVHVQILLMA